MSKKAQQVINMDSMNYIRLIRGLAGRADRGIEASMKKLTDIATTMGMSVREIDEFPTWKVLGEHLLSIPKRDSAAKISAYILTVTDEVGENRLLAVSPHRMQLERLQSKLEQDEDSTDDFSDEAQYNIQSVEMITRAEDHSHWPETKEKLRNSGLSKLTAAEKQALGLDK